MKLLKVVLPLLLIGSLSMADPLDPFHSRVSQVTQNDGDTLSTSQVTVGVCPGSTCPTLLSASQTASLNQNNNTNRRRCFSNTGFFSVWIGSNTTSLQTTGFMISESTATFSTYCTYSTAAIYATAASTETVTVLQERNSQQ